MLEILGRAKNLCVLEWNIVPVEFVNPFSLTANLHRPATRTPQPGCLQVPSAYIPHFTEALVPHIQNLALACKKLQTVKYTASIEKEFYSFSIFRDQDGNCIQVDSCKLDLGSSGCAGSIKRDWECMASTTIWDAWSSPYI